MFLKADNLSYTYPGGVRALQGLDWQARRGERWAVVGPNGAGKSTILLLLAGLIGPEGREGSVRWYREGKPLSRSPRIGYLFQNPDDQLIGTTVEDDVGFSLLKKGVKRESARQLVSAALKEVNLEGYQTRSSFQLSFGQKKRLGLAGLLVDQPEVLFLDEPSLGLDYREREELLKILLKRDQALFFASMDLELVARLADGVLLLDEGKIVDQGPPDSIFQKRELLFRHGLIPPKNEESRKN